MNSAVLALVWICDAIAGSSGEDNDSIDCNQQNKQTETETFQQDLQTFRCNNRNASITGIIVGITFCTFFGIVWFVLNLPLMQIRYKVEQVKAYFSKAATTSTMETSTPPHNEVVKDWKGNGHGWGKSWVGQQRSQYHKYAWRQNFVNQGMWIVPKLIWHPWDRLSCQKTLEDIVENGQQARWIPRSSFTFRKMAAQKIVEDGLDTKDWVRHFWSRTSPQNEMCMSTVHKDSSAQPVGFQCRAWQGKGEQSHMLSTGLSFKMTTRSQV